MNPIRHAIFDLDGTLVDSLPGIAWSIDAALSQCGLPPLRRDLKPLVGPPIRNILSTVAGVCEGERLDALESAFRSSYDSAGWRKTRCQQGAGDLLRRLLAGGVDLWLVTNKPAEATRKILDELKLANLFEETQSRDSRAPAFDSKAEILRDLLRRRNLRRGACLMIGDTAEDRDAAMAAGIRCAIVAHGYGPGIEGRLPAGTKRAAGWNDIVALCGAAAGAAERC